MVAVVACNRSTSSVLALPRPCIILVVIVVLFAPAGVVATTQTWTSASNRASSLNIVVSSSNTAVTVTGLTLTGTSSDLNIDPQTPTPFQSGLKIIIENCNIGGDINFMGTHKPVFDQSEIIIRNNVVNRYFYFLATDITTATFKKTNISFTDNEFKSSFYFADSKISNQIVTFVDSNILVDGGSIGNVYSFYCSSTTVAKQTTSLLRSKFTMTNLSMGVYYSFYSGSEDSVEASFEDSQMEIRNVTLRNAFYSFYSLGTGTEAKVVLKNSQYILSNCTHTDGDFRLTYGNGDSNMLLQLEEKSSFILRESSFGKFYYSRAYSNNPNCTTVLNGGSEMVLEHNTFDRDTFLLQPTAGTSGILAQIKVGGAQSAFRIQYNIFKDPAWLIAVFEAPGNSELHVTGGGTFAISNNSFEKAFYFGYAGGKSKSTLANITVSEGGAVVVEDNTFSEEMFILYSEDTISTTNLVLENGSSFNISRNEMRFPSSSILFVDNTDTTATAFKSQLGASITDGSSLIIDSNTYRGSPDFRIGTVRRTAGANDGNSLSLAVLEGSKLVVHNNSMYDLFFIKTEAMGILNLTVVDNSEVLLSKNELRGTMDAYFSSLGGKNNVTFRKGSNFSSTENEFGTSSWFKTSSTGSEMTTRFEDNSRFISYGDVFKSSLNCFYGSGSYALDNNLIVTQSSEILFERSSFQSLLFLRTSSGRVLSEFSDKSNATFRYCSLQSSSNYILRAHGGLVRTIFSSGSAFVFSDSNGASYGHLYIGYGVSRGLSQTEYRSSSSFLMVNNTMYHLSFGYVTTSFSNVTISFDDSVARWKANRLSGLFRIGDVRDGWFTLTYEDSRVEMEDNIFSSTSPMQLPTTISDGSFVRSVLVLDNNTFKTQIFTLNWFNIDSPDPVGSSVSILRNRFESTASEATINVTKVHTVSIDENTVKYAEGFDLTKSESVGRTAGDLTDTRIMGCNWNSVTKEYVNPKPSLDFVRKFCTRTATETFGETNTEHRGSTATNLNHLVSETRHHRASTSLHQASRSAIQVSRTVGMTSTVQQEGGVSPTANQLNSLTTVPDLTPTGVRTRSLTGDSVTSTLLGATQTSTITPTVSHHPPSQSVDYDYEHSRTLHNAQSPTATQRSLSSTFLGSTATTSNKLTPTQPTVNRAVSMTISRTPCGPMSIPRSLDSLSVSVNDWRLTRTVTEREVVRGDGTNSNNSTDVVVVEGSEAEGTTSRATTAASSTFTPIMIDTPAFVEDWKSAIPFGTRLDSALYSIELVKVTSEGDTIKPNPKGFAKFYEGTGQQEEQQKISLMRTNYTTFVLEMKMEPDYRIDEDEEIVISLRNLYFAQCPPGKSVKLASVVFTATPVPAVQATKTAVTVVTSTATIASMAGSGASAVDAQSLAVIGLMSCAQPVERKAMKNNRLLSPLATGNSYEGMILGNWLLLFLVAALQLAVVAGVKLIKKKDWDKAFILGRFPAFTLVAVTIQYQGTAASAVKLLHSETAGPSGLALGVVTIVVSLLLPVILLLISRYYVSGNFYEYEYINDHKENKEVEDDNSSNIVLSPSPPLSLEDPLLGPDTNTDAAVPVEDLGLEPISDGSGTAAAKPHESLKKQKTRPPKAPPVVPKWAQVLLPEGKWMPLEVRRRFSCLFAGYRRSERIWATLTTWSPTVVILGLMFEPKTNTACSAQFGTMAGFEFLIVLILLAVRPYRSLVTNILAAGSISCLAFVLLGSAIQASDPESEAAAMFTLRGVQAQTALTILRLFWSFTQFLIETRVLKRLKMVLREGSTLDSWRDASARRRAREAESVRDDLAMQLLVLPEEEMNNVVTDAVADVLVSGDIDEDFPLPPGEEDDFPLPPADDDVEIDDGDLLDELLLPPSAAQEEAPGATGGQPGEELAPKGMFGDIEIDDCLLEQAAATGAPGGSGHEQFSDAAGQGDNGDEEEEDEECKLVAGSMVAHLCSGGNDDHVQFVDALRAKPKKRRLLLGNASLAGTGAPPAGTSPPPAASVKKEQKNGEKEKTARSKSPVTHKKRPAPTSANSPPPPPKVIEAEGTNDMTDMLQFL